MVTIYLTNESIKVMDAIYKRGKLNVAYTGLFPLPSGCIDDGEILDSDLLKETLAGLPSDCKRRLKNVKLILDSYHFPFNRMVVPKLSEGKTRKYIKGEFSNIFDSEEKILYDYMVLDSNGRGQTILASAVSEEYLNSYLKIFETQKIKVISIDFDLSSVVSFAMVRITPAQENCLMVSLDGEYISVYLFIRGEYYYLSSGKATSKRGTPDFYEEVTNVISRMTQYSYAETQGELLKRIYLIAINDAEIEAIDELCEFFGQAVGLDTVRMNAEYSGIIPKKKKTFEMAQFVHNIGATVE